MSTKLSPLAAYHLPDDGPLALHTLWLQPVVAFLKFKTLAPSLTFNDVDVDCESFTLTGRDIANINECSVCRRRYIYCYSTGADDLIRGQTILGAGIAGLFSLTGQGAFLYDTAQAGSFTNRTRCWCSCTA